MASKCRAPRMQRVLEVALMILLGGAGCQNKHSPHEVERASSNRESSNTESPDAAPSAGKKSASTAGDASLDGHPQDAGTLTVDAGLMDTPASAECEQLAAAYCSRLEGCLPGSAISYYGDEAACRRYQATTCDSWLAFPSVAADPGYVAQLAKQLLGASCFEVVVRNAGGVNFSIAPPGERSDGEPCVIRSQCLSGYCSGDELCTVCSQQPPEEAPGDACAVRELSSGKAYDCGVGLVCDVPSLSCVKRVDIDEPCDLDASCPLWSSCVDGECAAHGYVGEACSEERKCRIELSCIDGRCEQPAPPPVEEQCGVCDGTRLCVGCEPGFACVFPLAQPHGPGSCVPTPKLGDPCDRDVTGPNACPLSLECIDGVCGIGEPSFVRREEKQKLTCVAGNSP